MKARHPITKKLWYFIDKCLPFGSSISCAHFQSLSDALAYLAEHRIGLTMVITNYLDDFLFVALILPVLVEDVQGVPLVVMEALSHSYLPVLIEYMQGVPLIVMQTISHCHCFSDVCVVRRWHHYQFHLAVS